MKVWSDIYTTGVASIDEQHQKLFEICGRIYDLLRQKDSYDKYDYILNLIDELKDYTVFHFNSEEEYMQQIGYKKFFTHKIEHQDFIEKVNNVDLTKIDEDQTEYIMGILEFVVKWIDEHILEKDKLIVGG
jgi:hemerythrin